MGLINSWKVVEQFEERMADYCGSRYAVAVDTCTAAIGLCLERVVAAGGKREQLSLPARTYLGVAVAIRRVWMSLDFHDEPWQGSYSIGLGVRDSACRLHKGCYYPGEQVCLSFQYRKHLKIGRGGMVLTDSAMVSDWLRKARFLGRSEHNGVPEFLGWHAFMEPERAARGLALMDSLPDHNDDLVFEYPDLREYKVLTE